MRSGPQDISIIISGIAPVSPDRNGNFISCKPGTAEFDAVHTFSVIRMTLALYDSDDDPFEWNIQGNHKPITVYPHESFSEEINASYSREERALRFLYAPSRRHPRETVYACRSFDCVAHETGHAILDHLKPGWHSNMRPQIGRASCRERV